MEGVLNTTQLAKQYDFEVLQYKCKRLHRSRSTTSLRLWEISQKFVCELTELERRGKNMDIFRCGRSRGCRMAILRSCGWGDICTMGPRCWGRGRRLDNALRNCGYICGGCGRGAHHPFTAHLANALRNPWKHECEHKSEKLNKMDIPDSNINFSSSPFIPCGRT